mgnify:CR=1 FL=1
MPLVPNAGININTDAFVDVAVSINKTLAVANTAEDLVLVPVGKKGRKFSVVNEGPGAAFIQVDAVATLTSVQVLPKDVWYEESVQITTKLSFIGEIGKLPHVRGVLWAGL